MELLTKNWKHRALALLLLVVACLGFVFGRNSATAEEPTVDDDQVVTAEEEYLLQLEFAEQQKYQEPETLVHDSAPEITNTDVSGIANRLRYADQHPTFDRNLPNIYDYTVGGDGLDPVVNYAIHKTRTLPHPNGGNMGLDLVKTRSMENTMYSPVTQGAADERGICQLRYVYHKPFMDSQEFFDPYNQIDYCVDVYLDWYNRLNGKRPLSNVRSARLVKDKAASRFTPL